jgi:23S rRNA (adenine2503-C2)-methyltransferase
MSGKDGFKRNLTAGEIVMQLLEAENLTSARRISNVVFMGIGEPLDNYDNLIKAIKIIMDKKGLAVGKRKITVSTVGIPDKIKKLADEHLGINLSISLHSADDNKRSSFMPINRKYNLRELIFSLKEYQSKEDIPVTFEYLLIGGLNDSKIDAETLSMYVKGIDSKVNLIVYNPIPAIDFHRSAASKVDFFKETLEKNKVFVTIRKERGSDIDAACGQLKSGNNKKDVS